MTVKNNAIFTIATQSRRWESSDCNELWIPAFRVAPAEMADIFVVLIVCPVHSERVRVWDRVLARMKISVSFESI